MLTAYYFTLALLAILAVHRLHLVRVVRGSTERPAPVPPARWPHVTIQLPMFNEAQVAERVIEAAASINYAGTFDIQVLDDSTDQTSAMVEAACARVARRGIRIEHVRRGSRSGFKAGALAEGMLRSDARYFAVFDADFIPSADFLNRLMPHFRDGIGMVQTRWGHLNREESLLTRVQAAFLDGHFAIESAARAALGAWFNFNGTAGIWRREAIEDAGGWSAATLTEDLDLSYRAQLAGWRFAFVPDYEVGAELPSTMVGFRGQQRRWATGSVQTARRLLGTILSSNESATTKREALFHMTANAAYPLTLVLSTLLVPSIAIRCSTGVTPLLLIDAVMLLISTSSLLVFYREGTKRCGAALSAREILAIVPYGVSLSVSNTVAFVTGLMEDGGTFHRTVKRGSRRLPIRERWSVPAGEILLAVFYLASIVVFLRMGWFTGLPFLVLFASSFILASITSWPVRQTNQKGSVESASIDASVVYAGD